MNKNKKILLNVNRDQKLLNESKKSKKPNELKGIVTKYLKKKKIISDNVGNAIKILDYKKGHKMRINHSNYQVQTLRSLPKNSPQTGQFPKNKEQKTHKKSSYY